MIGGSTAGRYDERRLPVPGSPYANPRYLICSASLPKRRNPARHFFGMGVAGLRRPWMRVDDAMGGAALGPVATAAKSLFAAVGSSSAGCHFKPLISQERGTSVAPAIISSI
jgi:hypothetical protein